LFVINYLIIKPVIKLQVTEKYHNPYALLLKWM